MGKGDYDFNTLVDLLLKGKVFRSRICFSLFLIKNRQSRFGIQNLFLNANVEEFLLHLYDSVRPRQHVRWNRQTDLLGGFEIDDELKLHRLFHGQVGGLSAFSGFVHVGGSAFVCVSIAVRI